MQDVQNKSDALNKAENDILEELQQTIKNVCIYPEECIEHKRPCFCRELPMTRQI